MTNKSTLSPKEIVSKMFENDEFSQWLGIKINHVSLGSCQIEMTVREDMTNGFKIAHGGISYSLADSAFAFASNSRGLHAVSIETSISHVKAIHVGDILKAHATELNLSSKLGVYSIEVTNQDNDSVALFKGTVYRKKTIWQ